MQELRELVLDTRPLERVIGTATAPIAAILERSLAGEELSFEDGLALLHAEGADLAALIRTADHVRSIDAGPTVTYVVNRNINFTNVCFVGCQFCAFARHRKDDDARTDSMETLLAKVQEAIDRGASEICMQGGINPEMDAFEYRNILTRIKARYPQLHVHAFSPMEIMYGARRTGMNYYDYISMLRDAGLGTIPGTAAEILDDEVREVLSHKKVDVRTWVEIITTAHKVGVRTTSTVMYAHIEKPEHVVRHLDILRNIQKETGGFTEFVPLRFIHTYTVLYQKGLVDPPPKGAVDMRMYAFSRLMLRGLINNLQTSWVKLGTELAQLSLAAGCNDFGGTLMEEQISKSAGADAGEYLPVTTIRSLIEGMGRIPQERTTLYDRVADEAHGTGHGPGWRSGRSTFTPGPELAS
ncbi:MAG: 5-amino-6-(D-ribitylamino)uracil--L-tyrosine 4-hydroxyphenyl transferase CofH [Deltaproteobacteria bacterium]|nr:5-amino-6-(D-ribitylamino)uracil--L-tyrosine 4-hydroxyphenyl transferase CofH [Deltaproteobacteria bacterium]